LLSRPSHFTSASRRAPSNANAKEPAVEKTVYTTAETFPTILRRTEIVAVGNVTLTPLQAAIERSTRKTVELTAMEKRIVEGDDTAFNSLTQELMYAVDTASGSCVANYHDLIPPAHDLEDEEPSDTQESTNPLENALRVTLIDYASIIRRCLALYLRPAQQATKADLTQRMYSMSTL
jgi:dedicator of cytokinesis protein 3